MPFFTRPNFEDRQIVQYTGNTITLSGQTNINNLGQFVIQGPILDFTGTTSASTLYTIAGVSGYVNYGNVSSFKIQPPSFIQSGLTGTTTVDVTGYILSSLDADGNIVWTQPVDINISGFTYDDSNKLTILNNNGSEYSVYLNQFSGLTVNGILSATTFYGSGLGLNNIPISGVTNLQSNLDLKTNLTDFVSHTGDTNNPHQTTFYNLVSTAHTHTISDIINLQSNLNLKFDKSGGTVTGDVLILGDVTILGTATTINTTTLTVADNVVTLNSNVTGNTAPYPGHSGIEILRGSGTTVALLWEEQNLQWEAGLHGSTKRILLQGDSLALLTSGHTHPISEINGLQDTLNNKFDVTGGTITGNVLVIGSVSATTFYGNGQYLTGLVTNDFYVTGGTYSNGTLTLDRQNGSVIVTGFTNVFTGNTSASCITNLYVTNLNSCSPLHIQNVSEGDVLIGENGNINVGIGTTSPTQKLHVSGNTLLSNEVNGDLYVLVDNKKVGGTGTRSAVVQRVVAESGGTNLVGSMYLSGYETDLTAFGFGDNGTGYLKNAFTMTLAGSYTYGSINIGTRGAPSMLRFFSGNQNFNSTSLRGSLDSNGNWGFGQNMTGQTAIVHIKGNGNTSSTNSLKIDNNSNSPLLHVKDSGNIGIGTENPTEKLHVSGNTKITGGLNIGSIGSGSPLFNLGLDSNGNVVTGTTGGGSTFTGGTISGPTSFTNGLTANTLNTTSLNLNGIVFTAITDTTVTGFTYDNNNKLTISRNQGQSDLNVYINTMSGLTVNGGITATTMVLTPSPNASLIVRGTATTRGILPEADNTYSLGSTSQRWASMYTKEIRLYESRTGAAADNDYISILAPNDLALTPNPAWSLVLPYSSGATFTLLGVYDGNAALNTSNTSWFTLSAGTNISLNQLAFSGGSVITINSTASGGQTFTGGTVNGPTNFTNGLTANTLNTTSLQITSGATAGYVLTATDSLGNSSWQAVTETTVLGTGLTIHFSGKTIFNLPTSPASGNISGDTTNAKFGMIQKIYHQSAVEPTFPATWNLVGEGVYFTNELNIIYAEYVTSSWIEYWIIQIQ